MQNNKLLFSLSKTNKLAYIDITPSNSTFSSLVKLTIFKLPKNSDRIIITKTIGKDGGLYFTSIPYEDPSLGRYLRLDQITDLSQIKRLMQLGVPISDINKTLEGSTLMSVVIDFLPVFNTLPFAARNLLKTLNIKEKTDNVDQRVIVVSDASLISHLSDKLDVYKATNFRYGELAVIADNGEPTFNFGNVIYIFQSPGLPSKLKIAGSPDLVRWNGRY